MECKNPSEWRVTENFFGGAPWYGVYRIRDIDEVDHSGNREYRGGYFPTRREAEIYAEYCNEEDADK